MSNKHAIVLIWDGKHLSNEEITQIASDLASVLVQRKASIPELISAKYYDTNGVQDALVASTIKAPSVEKENVENAIEQSLAIIGERFKETLTNTNGNLAYFAIQFNNALDQAFIEQRFACGKYIEDDNMRLIKAAKTIADNCNVILQKVPRTLVRKCHFTQTVVDIITQIYSRFI